LLEVETDSGITGIALGTAAIHHQSVQLVNELLVGRDPRATTMLWQHLQQANAHADGALTATIAALDIACWDAKAKFNDEPSWRTLGALRPRVQAQLRAPENDLEHWCRSIAKPAGVRSVVITSSGDAQQDLARLLIVREALSHAGSDCAVMLDAREQWSPKEAIRCVAEIERFIDLSWVEAPTLRHDFLGHKRILDSIRSGVCSGGHLTSAADFLPHLHHHSLSVVQLDVSLLGITAALQIADAAYGFEIPVTLTRSPGNLHAYVGAALPYCANIEFADNDSFVSGDVRIEDGWAVGGDRPGHGLIVESLSNVAA
jgi:L-alanine-DL-glutamate epimerase-like enolase superfamily enzyme